MNRFNQWWQENKDEVNKRRRAKYNEDKRFRERERARKRISRKRFPKPRIYYHQGKPIILWSVGRVADFLGVSKKTISNLENRRSIPVNRIIDELRRRWWPEKFIRWLKPMVELRKSREITAREFSQRVWNRWREDLSTNTFPVLGTKRGEISEQGRKKYRSGTDGDSCGPDYCKGEPNSQN